MARRSEWKIFAMGNIKDLFQLRMIFKEKIVNCKRLNYDTDTE